MPRSTHTISIILSLIVSVGMVSAAFYFSSSLGPSVADAESTEELLRAYARKDTDSDGLMDWQEELYGSDPADAHSIDPDLLDLEAVEQGKVELRFVSEEPEFVEDANMPGFETEETSLTDRFARQLFTDYLTGNSDGVPTEEALLAFIDAEIDELVAANTARSGYTSASVQTVPGGEEALRAYAASFERIIALHNTNTEQSELIYFADAVHGRDATGLATVRKIGAAYSSAATSLAGMSVPTELRAAHVRVVNALSRMGTIVTDMAEFESDPLLSLVSVSSYEATITELGTSFALLYPHYAASNIVFEEGEAGASFFLMIKIIASQTSN